MMTEQLILIDGIEFKKNKKGAFTHIFCVDNLHKEKKLVKVWATRLSDGSIETFHRFLSKKAKDDQEILDTIHIAKEELTFCLQEVPTLTT